MDPSLDVSFLLHGIGSCSWQEPCSINAGSTPIQLSQMLADSTALTQQKPKKENPWDRYLEEIFDLRIKRGMEIKDVRQAMIDRHGFKRSTSAYHKKFKEWKLLAKLPHPVLVRICYIERDRRRLGLKTAYTYYGMPVKMEQIDQEIDTLFKYSRQSSTPSMAGMPPRYHSKSVLSGITPWTIESVDMDALIPVDQYPHHRSITGQVGETSPAFVTEPRDCGNCPAIPNQCHTKDPMIQSENHIGLASDMSATLLENADAPMAEIKAPYVGLEVQRMLSAIPNETKELRPWDVDLDFRPWNWKGIDYGIGITDIP